MLKHWLLLKRGMQPVPSLCMGKSIGRKWDKRKKAINWDQYSLLAACFFIEFNGREKVIKCQCLPLRQQNKRLHAHNRLRLTNRVCNKNCSMQKIRGFPIKLWNKELMLILKNQETLCCRSSMSNQPAICFWKWSPCYLSYRRFKYLCSKNRFEIVRICWT